ncbi:anti-adapter protein IraP [Erwinia sp. BNK-24-b]|uniref:anti-adapter protein IraP n=1 Tax=Erwinia TaxID=551 RepID=UPI001FF02EF8|nr:anti-adapter protein IraP [Erwinia phyllosphaerae]MBV4365963.1 anti-adapter protein IraP [Erwinia phyllosphaerae]
MKQLVIDILMKMATIEVSAKELTAQVEAQSLLISALLLTAGKGDNAATISDNIQNAIVTATTSGKSFLQSDVDLLLTHVNRLLAVTRYVDENANAEQS